MSFQLICPRYYFSYFLFILCCRRCELASNLNLLATQSRTVESKSRLRVDSDSQKAFQRAEVIDGLRAYVLAQGDTVLIGNFSLLFAVWSYVR